MSEARLYWQELFVKAPRLLSPLFEGECTPYGVIRRLREFLCYISPEGFEEICEGVFVSPRATIAQTAKIEPPTVISDGAQIRHCAYIRGSVFIGEGCVVGNSTELKNAIMMDGSLAPHFNYLGDSILGERAHIGAGVIASNLRCDKRTVRIPRGEGIDSGMRKLGAMIGDGAEIGCGCILNPGCVVGKDAVIYPGICVSGEVPYRKTMISKGLFK